MGRIGPAVHPGFLIPSGSDLLRFREILAFFMEILVVNFTYSVSYSDNSDIMKNKLSVLTDVGFRKVETEIDGEGNEALCDFDLAYHTCVTLMKLSHSKKEEQSRIATDHPVITAIVELIKSGQCYCRNVSRTPHKFLNLS